MPTAMEQLERKLNNLPAIERQKFWGSYENVRRISDRKRQEVAAQTLHARIDART